MGMGGDVVSLHVAPPAQLVSLLQCQNWNQNIIGFITRTVATIVKIKSQLI